MPVCNGMIIAKSSLQLHFAFGGIIFYTSEKIPAITILN